MSYLQFVAIIMLGIVSVISAIGAGFFTVASFVDEDGELVPAAIIFIITFVASLAGIFSLLSAWA